MASNVIEHTPAGTDADTDADALEYVIGEGGVGAADTLETSNAATKPAPKSAVTIASLATSDNPCLTGRSVAPDCERSFMQNASSVSRSETQYAGAVDEARTI
jgi:hypothetical protein